MSNHLTWPCCGYVRSGGHNATCTFYGEAPPAESGANPKDGTSGANDPLREASNPDTTEGEG